MNEIEKRLGIYFDRLVPVEGKADTKAGEIVRALSKLAYRYINDGDVIGVECGNETCNAPARFLIDWLPTKFGEIIGDMWGELNEGVYERKLYGLISEVLDYLDTTDLDKQPNDKDMFDYEQQKDLYWADDDMDEYEARWGHEWEDEEDE